MPNKLIIMLTQVCIFISVKMQALFQQIVKVIFTKILNFHLLYAKIKMPNKLIIMLTQVCIFISVKMQALFQHTCSKR
ncbi:hypothetical protein DW063_11015 [Ruminococcus sp. AF43-11]|nr:hypothetical protein DW063_11015 [Ruminococcus sp. AF43-11]